MKLKALLVASVASALLAASACVERRLFIRSEPPGAPVFIDEQYAGQTPLEHEFVHYGVRRVRVGPVRDENEALQFQEQEREVPVRAPWYETFGLDFFFEVLWPGILRDEHRPAAFVLEPRPRGGAARQDVEEIIRRGDEYRKRPFPVAEGPDETR